MDNVVSWVSSIATNITFLCQLLFMGMYILFKTKHNYAVLREDDLWRILGDMLEEADTLLAPVEGAPPLPPHLKSIINSCTGWASSMEEARATSLKRLLRAGSFSTCFVDNIEAQLERRIAHVQIVLERLKGARAVQL